MNKSEKRQAPVGDSESALEGYADAAQYAFFEEATNQDDAVTAGILIEPVPANLLLASSSVVVDVPR